MKKATIKKDNILIARPTFTLNYSQEVKISATGGRKSAFYGVKSSCHFLPHSYSLDALPV